MTRLNEAIDDLMEMGQGTRTEQIIRQDIMDGAEAGEKTIQINVPVRIVGGRTESVPVYVQTKSKADRQGLDTKFTTVVYCLKSAKAKTPSTARNLEISCLYEQVIISD